MKGPCDDRLLKVDGNARIVVNSSYDIHQVIAVEVTNREKGIGRRRHLDRVFELPTAQAPIEREYPVCPLATSQIDVTIIGRDRQLLSSKLPVPS